MSEVEHGSLVRLLSEPRETLKVEYKSWLNLKENNGKAKLAKAAIAMANVGGGTIVIGIREAKLKEKSQWISEAKPEEIAQYRDDDIGGAIGKYADPVPECSLEFAEHPNTEHQHAIITVFGGHTEPVIAKKTYGTELKEHRCYIRKMGPARSEEPNSTLEWRELFRRCVLAQRETMIDAFRGIIDGRVDVAVGQQSDGEMHTAFLEKSRERWRELTDTFPQDDPARLGKGYFEIAFSILGLDQNVPLADIKKVMQETSARISTIWLLFDDFDRRARPMGDSIETVYADHSDRSYDLHAFYYWRARDDGRFYLIRGYQEDYDGDFSKFFYIVPVWRIGQALDYAATVCRLLGENLEFLFSTKYAGLKGRRLFNTDNRAYFFPPLKGYVAEIPDMPLETLQLSPRQVEDNLPEIVFNLLRPLYTQFNYFELPPNVVAKEVQEMRQHSR